jgi:hypothetical protein
VLLEDTDYSARADANGDVVIGRLVAGPYKVVVIDSLLEPLDITLPTPIKLNVVRDSVYRATLDVPTANDFVEGRCRHDGIWKVMPRPRTDVVWMVGRVVGPDLQPLEGMTASVALGSRADVARAGMSPRTARSTRTGTDGIFQLCPSSFHLGDTVRVEMNHRELPAVEFLYTLPDSLTVLPLIRQTRRP